MTTRPLAGVRVLVPRARQQAADLSDRIRAAGGEPVEAPVLQIEPGELQALEDALRDVAAGAFEMVCFTSPNAVAAVSATLASVGLDASAFDGARVLCCVGPGTARAVERQLTRKPDLVPDVATTAALGAAVPAGSGRVLLPRADIASPVLPGMLRSKGYTPVEVTAYRTGRPTALPASVLADLRAGRIHVIAVASPSTARNLVALAGDSVQGARIVSIGPVTSAACASLGLEVAAEAEPHTMSGLVAAVERLHA